MRSLTLVALLALVPVLGACGSDDADDAKQAEKVTEPQCRSVDVTNAFAGEKVDAALCFGLGYDDAYACRFVPATNSTTCEGAGGTRYVVEYSETSDGTVGEVFDLFDGGHLGSVVQGRTGFYEIAVDSGASASCAINGDVATLCVD
jgi:hypothetical protein